MHLVIDVKLDDAGDAGVLEELLGQLRMRTDLLKRQADGLDNRMLAVEKKVVPGVVRRRIARVEEYDAQARERRLRDAGLSPSVVARRRGASAGNGAAR
jgi:hypothetical protein